MTRSVTKALKGRRPGRGRARVARLSVLFLLIALVVPLGSLPSQANHGTRTLQLHQERLHEQVTVGSNGNLITTHTLATVGNSYQVHATLSSPATTNAINIDFELEAGDPDGNSGFTPDETCTIPVGSDDCHVDVIATTPGMFSIRGWIDHDGDDAVVDGDVAEGRYAGLLDCNLAGEVDVVNDVVTAPADPDIGIDSAHVDGLECQFLENGTQVGVQGTTVNSPDLASATPGNPIEPDDTDVVEARWDPGTPTPKLNCEPEVSTSPPTGTGSTETYVCTVRNETNDPATPMSGQRIDGENLGGANDPDNSAAAGTADYTNERIIGEDNGCVTGGSGSCQIVVPAQDAEQGAAEICFWIDADGDAAFNPAGVEEDGGLCGEAVAAPEWNNQTDKVHKSWTPRTVIGVDATPEVQGVQLGNTATVTATVFDQFSQQSTGQVQVNFEFFSGSLNDRDGNNTATADRSCVTAAGQCAVSYSTTATVAGTDLICVWINNAPVLSGTSPNGTCDAEPRADTTADEGTPNPTNDDQDVVEVNWSVGPPPSPSPSPSPSPTSTASPGPSPSPSPTPGQCEGPTHGNFSSSYFPYGNFGGGLYVASGNVIGASNTVREVISGAGEEGGPHVVVANRAGAVLSQFMAYSGEFRGGVRVGTADIDGDGVQEIITAPGPTGGPHIKVLNSGGGSRAEWMAYGSTFSGGVFVAGADVDGDGNDEVITAPDAGGGPHIRVWNVTAAGGVSEMYGWMAYEPSYTGGVRVAGGQVTSTASAGDREEVVTVPGTEREINVRVWRDGNLVNNWQAYSGFRGGAYVAVGDYDNLSDNQQEVITGAGAGGGPHVQVWRSDASGATPIFGFMGVNPAFTGGMRVAAGDVDQCSREPASNGTNEDEAVLGTGPGLSQVRIFR